MTKKKILGLIMIIALFCLSSYKGVIPDLIQGAFYIQSNYSCIYLKGNTEASKKTWLNYKLEINSSNIGYDGMNGNYNGIDLLRIKANTSSPGKELVIYLDNIKMLDSNGKAIFTWDFNDNKTHGPYLSQGIKMEGSETIQSLNGEKCFLLHAKTETKYGYSGVEIQWTLPKCPDTKNGKWNLSKNKYSLSFDYYYAAE
jgi:hypothetical protein